MQTVAKKSLVQIPPSKQAAVDTPHAAFPVVGGAGFAMAVTAVIGRLPGLVTVDRR